MYKLATSPMLRVESSDVLRVPNSVQLISFPIFQPHSLRGAKGRRKRGIGGGGGSVRGMKRVVL